MITDINPEDRLVSDETHRTQAVKFALAGEVYDYVWQRSTSADGSFLSTVD